MTQKYGDDDDDDGDGTNGPSGYNDENELLGSKKEADAVKIQPWRNIWPPAQMTQKPCDDGMSVGGGTNGPSGYNDENELLGSEKVEEK